MRLAGRRLQLASDDFVLISCLSIVARLCGTVALLTVSVIHGEILYGPTVSVECAGLGRYTLASLVVFCALLAQSVTMCRTAGVGGVLQPSMRSRVGHVLVIGLLLRVVELGCAIYGVLKLREVVRFQLFYELRLVSPVGY